MDASKSPFDDPESPGKSESATSDASSATAIFGTVSQKPAPQQDEDLLKSLMGSQTPVTEPPKPAPSMSTQTKPWTPVVPPESATPSPPSSGPGEFTEMFRALQNPAPISTSSPMNPPGSANTPAVAPSKPPDDLSNVFTQVVVEKTTFTARPTAPPTPRPGEFTQLLQTLSASTPKPEVEVPAASPQPPAAGTPGSFTQAFNTASAHPEAETPQTATFPIPAPSGTPSSSKPESGPPGDFTRMFQAAPSLGPSVSQSPIPPATPAQPKPGPGAFTQMFSARPTENTPDEDPLRSLKAAPPPVNTFQFSGTQARPQESTPAAQGGFTQLIQALNKEEPAKPPEPMIAPPPLEPAPPAPAAGGFTQLLQTLSTEPAPKQAAPPPVIPPVQSSPVSPPVSGAPGEFTRVISGSQLRDLQAQSSAPSAPVAPPPQPPRAVAPPMQFPQAPAFSPAPPMPQIPGQMPGAHNPGASPAAMPHFQPPAYQFPLAPAPAPPAPPPPAPGKLQQYLPLILILNIFVLLVIVVILIFVLRHH